MDSATHRRWHAVLVAACHKPINVLVWLRMFCDAHQDGRKGSVAFEPAFWPSLPLVRCPLRVPQEIKEGILAKAVGFPAVNGNNALIGLHSALSSTSGCRGASFKFGHGLTCV